MKEDKCEELIRVAWEQKGDVLENARRVKEVFLSSDLFNLREAKKRIKELGDHIEKN